MRLVFARHLAECDFCESGEDGKRCRVGERWAEEAREELKYEFCMDCRKAGCEACDCEDREDCAWSGKHADCRSPGKYGERDWGVGAHVAV